VFKINYRFSHVESVVSVESVLLTFLYGKCVVQIYKFSVVFFSQA